MCDLIRPDYNSSKLIILDTNHSWFLAKNYDHLKKSNVFDLYNLSHLYIVITFDQRTLIPFNLPLVLEQVCNLKFLKSLNVNLIA